MIQFNNQLVKIKNTITLSINKMSTANNTNFIEIDNQQNYSQKFNHKTIEQTTFITDEQTNIITFAQNNEIIEDKHLEQNKENNIETLTPNDFSLIKLTIKNNQKISSSIDKNLNNSYKKHSSKKHEQNKLELVSTSNEEIKEQELTKILNRNQKVDSSHFIQKQNSEEILVNNSVNYNLSDKNRHLNLEKIQSQIFQSKEKQIIIGTLSQLYHHQGHSYFNFSKFNYYHSLVPTLEKLSKCKKIIFHANLVSESVQERLLPENSVNIHLFKPYYVQKADHIRCYVATRQIMKQAMMALYHVTHYHKYTQIQISIVENKETVHDLIKHWVLKDKILVCRVESLLGYLLLQWLDIKGFPIQKIKEISVQLERTRLSPKRIPYDNVLENILQQHSLTRIQFFQYFRVQKMSSKSIFLNGFNFVYHNEEISAVMLPWGVQLAEQLTHSLYKINPNIKRIGVVGGVGYTGSSECKVDDIFIPNFFMEGDDEKHQIKRFQNRMSQRQTTKYFTDFKIVKGCLKSVFPELGKLSNIQTYRKSLHKIDALDMEFEAIHKVVKEHQKSELGAIYYIMDLPKQNINLGDTYYRKQFLEQLFGTFKRGKLFCFEKTLSYLVEKEGDLDIQIKKVKQ